MKNTDRLLILLLVLQSAPVETLLCLRCNSLTHGSQCGTDALSLADNSSIVVTCQGTCKVNKVTSPSGEEIHMRDCSKTKKTGCVSKNFKSKSEKRKGLPGQLCQCDRDLCNVDFTYSRENRPVVSAHFRISDPEPTSTESAATRTDLAHRFNSYFPFLSCLFLMSKSILF